MAFLHTIRLKGFKTFARSTELLIEPGVTVIIGPNGSGKSNIADAVLWALGEQSPTAIRGRNMQDVIFSGSEGRKGAASAEVTLAFDNSSGAFPTDYEEVEVTRSVSRDGSSSYRLNGSACRLVDIQELISGVGLGREMHSVISQGRVEEFLSSTPLARRAMIEEAAGLGRYKKRRQRSQAKLEKVQANLDRVEDIEIEVRKALRPLKAQVTAAERYAEATEELAAARTRLLLLELTSLTRERSERGQKRVEVTSSREESAGELEAIRASRVREEEEFARTIAEREALTARYHEARGHTERIQSRGATLGQRLSRLEADLERTRRRREQAEGELEAARSRVDSIAAAPGYSAARLELVQRAAEELNQLLLRTRTELGGAETAHEEAKDLVFELESNRSRLAQERDLIRRELAERAARRTQIDGESRSAADRMTGIEAGLETLGGERQSAQALVAGAKEAAEAARERVRQLETGLTQAQAKARKAGERLADLDARERVAQAIISRREGVPEQARRLRDERDGARLVIELLQVDPGYERAVAAALGSLAYAVVLPGGAELALLGREGSLEMVWPDSLEDRAAPQADLHAQLRPESLWRHFSLPQPLGIVLNRLLPPLLVAEDLAAASLLSAPVLGGQEPLVVTLQGEIARGGYYAGRRLEAGTDVFLGARAELEAVLKDRGASLEERELAEQELERLVATLEKARQLVRETDQAEREAARAAAGLDDELTLYSRRLEEARKELDEARQRRERDAEMVASLEEQLEAAQTAYEEHGARVTAAREGLVGARTLAEEARNELGRVEQKRSQAMLLQVKLRERRRAYEEEQGRAQDQRDRAARTVRSLTTREERLALSIPVVERLRATVVGLGEELETRVAGLAAGVEDSRRRTDGFADALKDHGRREAELQQRLAELSESQVEVEVALAHLGDRIEEREREIAELRRRHLSPRGLAAGDVSDDDAEALRSLAERLERKRERIGPINPLAEQEYKETSERAEFLAEQRRDLESSVAEIARIIGELDEHIESTFNEVFEQTREHFEEMVGVLFPGGRGLLKLEEIGGERAEDLRGHGRDGEDPDAASEAAEEAAALDESAPDYARKGVVLEIKPPRKAPRALSLLSGGEKALAAIAFLFALFLARPAPFYILDEVEAALDDTNIGRFLSLVRRFQDRTQFIVITHQRRTMEVADTLYGVAMDADGTSRVLSRRLTVANDDKLSEKEGSVSL